MKIFRHAALILAAIGTQLPTLAQDAYPNKPVMIVVPQAAGGANDAIARIVAQKLSENTGQSFVVDNRPGAGGNIGTALTARARPDGYTLLLTADSAYVINPALYKNAGFNPLKDFEPVSTVATSGYVIVANSTFAAKNIGELIEVARASPGKVTIGSAGNGTVNHLFGEMLSKAAGIRMTHVPYKGASAAVTDLVGGQVQVSVQSLPSSLPFIRSDKLKVLGVVNERRLSSLPDVPTVAETVKGLSYNPWYGLLAPAGTPEAIVARLQAELAKVLDSADVKERLAAIGCEPMKSTPAKFATQIREELPRWAQIVKDSGAMID
jgi:tripartite-type tricarboxylate transporter receptor subunit TctC